MKTTRIDFVDNVSTKEAGMYTLKYGWAFAKGAFEDEYITAYQSTDIVPTIYKSVNTPRDKNGLVSGKPKTYYRTQSSEWVTEKTFIKQYQKIREKF